MNLATIQKIIDIQPIPDAENIEVASVLGWKVVVKKGEFKIGDECVYIQIDTVVPEDPDFEFLRPRGFRIRTIKLRGQISQGLVLPLSIIDDEKIKLFEGKDVTDIIGVKKYEKPQPEEPVKIPKSWWRKQWWLFKTNYLYKWFPFL